MFPLSRVFLFQPYCYYIYLLSRLNFRRVLSADKNIFIQQQLTDFERINEEEKETAAHVPSTSAGNNDPQDEFPRDENTSFAFLNMQPTTSTANKGTQKGHRRPICTKPGNPL